MLLSYCYIFSHTPACSQDFKPSSPVPSDSPSSSLRSTPSSTSFEPNLESDSSLLSSVTDWVSSVASSVRSLDPSSVTSLFKGNSKEEFTKATSSLQNSHSQLPSLSLASWFASSTTDPAPVTQAQVQVPDRPYRVTPEYQNAQETIGATSGRTTFTFVLFGAASSAAVYLLLRNRRTMNKLHTAKSLAYKDARAWRRVALDFARINALATTRVQNLVAASLRDGQAFGDIGRQIERELEEAARSVAERRNWIREQDAKDAKAAASSTGQRNFEEAWSDVVNLDRTGFFFGSRPGRRDSCLGKQGRWDLNSASRHCNMSDVQSDGLTFRGSEAWTRSTPETDTPSSKRSAKLRWQRVAGVSAAAAHDAAPAPAPGNQSTSAHDAAAETTSHAEANEEWIGDVDRAMRERDLKTSTSSLGASDQAAVDAFSHYDAEASVDPVAGLSSKAQEATAEEEDHLLPVSDLNIATNGRLPDEPDQACTSVNLLRKLQKTKLEPTQVRTTVTSSAEYSYPISDQFKDMEDIFLAAWDDSFAGLSHSTDSATSASAQDKPKTQASPNRELFDKLRSKSINGKSSPKLTDAEITDIMAEHMWQGAISEVASSESPTKASADASVQELIKRLEGKDAELASQRHTVRELSERLDTMREMCHDLTDEAQRRDKTHRIQIEQLEQKVGLFTVWAEEMQRRLGLENPPFFASLRKPLKRD